MTPGLVWGTLAFLTMALRHLQIQKQLCIYEEDCLRFNQSELIVQDISDLVWWDYEQPERDVVNHKL